MKFSKLLKTLHPEKRTENSNGAGSSGKADVSFLNELDSIEGILSNHPKESETQVGSTRRKRSVSANFEVESSPMISSKKTKGSRSSVFEKRESLDAGKNREFVSRRTRSKGNHVSISKTPIVVEVLSEEEDGIVTSNTHRVKWVEAKNSPRTQEQSPLGKKHHSHGNNSNQASVTAKVPSKIGLRDFLSEESQERGRTISSINNVTSSQMKTSLLSGSSKAAIRDSKSGSDDDFESALERKSCHDAEELSKVHLNTTSESEQNTLRTASCGENSQNSTGEIISDSIIENNADNALNLTPGNCPKKVVSTKNDTSSVEMNPIKSQKSCSLVSKNINSSNVEDLNTQKHTKIFNNSESQQDSISNPNTPIPGQDNSHTNKSSDRNTQQDLQETSREVEQCIDFQASTKTKNTNPINTENNEYIDRGLGSGTSSHSETLSCQHQGGKSNSQIKKPKSADLEIDSHKIVPDRIKVCKEWRKKSYKNGEQVSDRYYFLCPQCPVETATSSQMKTHYEGHVNSRKLKCYYCTWTANRLDFLHAHMNNHEAYEEFKKKNEKKFYLDKKSSGPKDSDPSLIHVCKLCNLAFRKVGNLRSHELAHTSEKKFKCSNCKFVTKRKADLVKHLKTCAKYAQKCVYCEMNFKNMKRLRIHIKNDHSVFMCQFCERSFDSERGLKAHKRVKHDIKVSVDTRGTDESDKKEQELKANQLVENDESEISDFENIHEEPKGQTAAGVSCNVHFISDVDENESTLEKISPNEEGSDKPQSINYKDAVISRKYNNACDDLSDDIESSSDENIEEATKAMRISSDPVDRNEENPHVADQNDVNFRDQSLRKKSYEQNRETSEEQVTNPPTIANEVSKSENSRTRDTDAEGVLAVNVKTEETEESSEIPHRCEPLHEISIHPDQIGSVITEHAEDVKMGYYDREETESDSQIKSEWDDEIKSESDSEVKIESDDEYRVADEI